VMLGVGNVYRCEVLWATGISPFAPVGALSESDAIRLVNTAASQLRSQLLNDGPAPAHQGGAVKGRLAVYARNGQGCPRCPGTIDRTRMGPHQRILYWCPSCQSHLDPRSRPHPDDTPMMDPRPAAIRFLADLPWNRD